ncbi:hypothetical protein MNBD_DELTA01-108 [hydrothermal vent metagenome]|uniref:Transporter n=1 Tax=hydrothermal vent metagenome TaxID=652676 RepID=A0A3B0RD48_9ZZZZ
MGFLGRPVRRFFIFFVLALVLTIPAAAEAYVGICCAKCGGNMPLNIPGGGVPATYELRVKLSPAFMRMEGMRGGTDSVNENSLISGGMASEFMAAPSYMDMRMMNMTVGYSYSDDIFLGAMFMWKENRMGMKFNQPMRNMTGREGYIMESGGMGDVMLMGKYRLYTDDPDIPKSQVSLFMGLSLPTGSTGEKNSNHPVVARQRELLPYAMQLGTGTFDPSIGLLYEGSLSPWWWGANAIYTARVHDNSRDWRYGDEFRLDIYGMHQLTYNLVAGLQLNGKYRGRIDGEADEARTGESGRRTSWDPTSGYMSPAWDPDNYGGKTVGVTAELQWQPKPLHIIALSVGTPLYQDLNGRQLEEDYTVMLTWYIEIPTKKSKRYVNKKKKGSSRLGF